MHTYGSREAEGSRGKQREAEGSRGKQREAEGSRGKQREAEERLNPDQLEDDQQHVPPG
jgi:hypothetical protein